MALKQNPWRLDAKVKNRWKFVHETNLIIKVHWPHCTSIRWLSKISKFILFCFVDWMKNRKKTERKMKTHCVPKGEFNLCIFVLLSFSLSVSPYFTHRTLTQFILPLFSVSIESMVVFMFDIPYSSLFYAKWERMKYIESGLLKRDRHRNQTNWILCYAHLTSMTVNPTL